MQAISTQALSSRSSTATLANRAKRNARQAGRPVVVAAAKGNGEDRKEQKGPNPAVMQTLGAFAAVQLALGGPAFAQDPLPDSAESQSGRDAVNKETDQAPGLGDIGKNLGLNLFGGGGNAPDPGQAKDAAKQAANKAQNAAPDLSGVFDRAQRNIDKIGKEANGAQNQFPDAITNLGNKAQKKVSKASSDVASSSGPSQAADKAKQGADKASKTAGKAAGKAKNAGPDLSGLLDDIQGKVTGDLDTTQKKVQSDIDTTTNKVKGDVDTTTGKVKGDVGATSGKVKSDVSTAKNAAPDLSGLLDDIQGKVTGDLDTTQKKVQSDIDTTTNKVKGDVDTTTGKVKGDVSATSGQAKNAAPDLSSATTLPNPQDLLSRVQGRSNSFDALARQADKVNAGTQKFQSSVASKGSKAGDKAQKTAKNVAGKAKNASPDLSFDPFKFFSEPQNASKDAAKSAKELQGTGGQNFSAGGGPNPSSKAGKDLAKGLKGGGSGDLPAPDVGKDVDTSSFKDINKKPSEGTLSK